MPGAGQQGYRRGCWLRTAAVRQEIAAERIDVVVPDVCARMGRIDHQVVADVETNVMAVRAADAIEDQVAWLQLAQRHPTRLGPLKSGVVQKVHPGLGPRHQRQTGAVERARAGGTPLVGLTDLGLGKRDDRRDVAAGRVGSELTLGGISGSAGLCCGTSLRSSTGLGRGLKPVLTPVSYTHLRAHETVLDLV